MKEYLRGEERPRELTTQKDVHQEEQGRLYQDNAANNPPGSLVGQQIFDTLRLTPSGEDPVFWPIRVLNEFNDLIVNRAFITNKQEAALAEKAAPLEETIRKVKTAYEIIAYPHCQQEGRRERIEAELETNRQLFGIDQVELNDTELGILAKLAVTKKLPFDPQKRIYDYSEVPLSPYVDPFGRRHMTTAEIQEWLAKP